MPGLCFLQCAPPSVVARIMLLPTFPWLPVFPPTAQPWLTSGKAMPHSPAFVPDHCFLQWAPPSEVTRITSPVAS